MDIEVKKQFTRASINTFDLTSFSNLDIELAEKTLISELDERLELNDQETKSQRCEFFKIPNSNPEDYSEKVYQISEGKFALAGIRHMGGNIEKPFISFWSDYDLESMNDLIEIKKILSTEFNIFKPKDISFWLNPTAELSKELEQRIQPNLRYVVGEVSSLKAAKLPLNYDKVTLTLIENESYREWYEELYKDFHSQNIELKDLVPINDTEDMSDCLNDNLMFYIEVDGIKAGIIAGCKDDLLGRSGVYFTEILLSKVFKGKGLAVAAQRKFIDKLPNSIEMIWGTIDSKNIPSTKTALRVGRQSIRNEFFLPINSI